MFSVVIPLYNKAGEIDRCLQSVLSQTFAEFDVIVVDDGSTDESAERVRKYSDPRIRLIQQRNAGVAEARNRGLREAGEWIAFLDADDSWLPGHLANLDALRRRAPEAAFLFTAYWVDKGRGLRRKIGMSAGRSARVDYLALPDGKLVPSCTAMRRDALLEAGGYREMFGEDVDVWFRMGSLYPVAYSPEATAVWHLDAENRRCDEEAKSVQKYVPGSLLPSLRVVAEKADKPAYARAVAYLKRRERRAILKTLQSGDAAHARTLYVWWCGQFGEHDREIEALLAAPAALHRMLGTMQRVWQRGHSLAGYGWHRITTML